LGLEQDAAATYHQLGIMAQEREEYEEADKRYRKALEMKERLGHPPAMVNTLAQFGLLMAQQGRFQEALAWFGKALAIAAKYKMRVGAQILVDLARVMKAMGEEPFAASWRAAFNEEPPLDLIREAVRRFEEKNGDENT